MDLHFSLRRKERHSSKGISVLVSHQFDKENDFNPGRTDFGQNPLSSPHPDDVDDNEEEEEEEEEEEDRER
eukprot:7961985-Karenia_brevis.AAC.1